MGRPLPILIAALVLLLSAAPVLAQTLTGETRVVDEAGVLSEAQVGEALDAIGELEDSRNVQMWALFVGTTSGQPITDFADAVAAENGLGGNDALLVVAVEDRRDSLWVGDLLDDVTDEEIDRIIANEIEPRLADGNWGAAIAAAAGGLDEALGGTTQPDPGEEPAPQPAPSAGSGTNPLPLLIALALVGGGLWLIWNRVQQGRAAADDDRERTRQLTQLSQKANALLIETDELLRHNTQELGFVEAEFGADAAKPFQEALASARAELQAAFKIRQRLDDNQPEEPPQRAELLNELIARCTSAQELVEEQTEKFRELRDLERRAPEVLDEAERGAAVVAQRIPGVEAAVATLQAEAAGSSKAVHGNVAEARKRLELVARGTVEGRAALQRDDRPGAGRAAKASQDALAQAAALLDAVDREAAVLAEARTELSAAVAQARADVASAGAAVTRASDTDQADELEAARAKLEAATEALNATPGDLVLAYRLAREAESAADAVVAKVHQGEERRAKERAAAEASIRAAELQVGRVEQFIAARHHGVGRRPRTSLSEADAALENARQLRDSDALAAVAEARRAGELADAAYRSAQREFSATDLGGQGGTVVINGQPYSMGRGSGWGDDVGGAILGGIIGSILSGGGRRGGGGFGGFGGGGGGFGGFGGGGGGGFGGGGRSFGGGFGGGGGRSRGGGW